MSDPNPSPVSLPAGSYDYDALKRGLDKAAKGAAKNYESSVDNAIKESAAIVYETKDPSAELGYVLRDFERSDLGITETIQVYDPKAAEKIAEEGPEVALIPTTPQPADAAPAPVKE